MEHGSCYERFQMPYPNRISVVIPTLNAAAQLAATLKPVRKYAGEVIIADGGSADDTCAIASAGGARVVPSEKGRGLQMRIGAAAATGDWLLFLHADTVLPEDWFTEVSVYMADPANADRAAAFTFALDDPSPQARRIEYLVAWRTRRLGLPYGDQGLLISRRHYDRLGGFRPVPLMEDVDIVRRIGRSNLDVLGVRAVTSAERYRRGGWWGRPVRNICCLALYFLGVPPRILVRLYR
jgi:rSAM/selenodomain-associated transferase 2